MFDYDTFACEVFYRVIHKDTMHHLKLTEDEAATITTLRKQNSWDDFKFTHALQAAVDRYVDDLLNGFIESHTLDFDRRQIVSTMSEIKNMRDSNLEHFGRELFKSTFLNTIQENIEVDNKIEINGNFTDISNLVNSAIQNALRGVFTVPKSDENINRYLDHFCKERGVSDNRDSQVKIAAMAFKGALKDFWEENPEQAPKIQVSSALTSKAGQDFRQS